MMTQETTEQPRRAICVFTRSHVDIRQYKLRFDVEHKNRTTMTTMAVGVARVLVTQICEETPLDLIRELEGLPGSSLSKRATEEGKRCQLADSG